MSVSSRSQNSSACSSGVSPMFPQSNFFCDSLHLFRFHFPCCQFLFLCWTFTFVGYFYGLSLVDKEATLFHALLSVNWVRDVQWASGTRWKLWSAGCWSGLLVCHSHGHLWTEEIAATCELCARTHCLRTMETGVWTLLLGDWCLTKPW